MTANELIEQLQILVNKGLGECEVKCFDHSENEWISITYLFFGNERESIDIFTKNLD